MAKGKAPVPVEIRNAQGGTPRQGAVSHRPAKSPVVLGQRIVSKDMVKPFFKLPPEGQKMWDEIVVYLIEYNVGTTLDAPNLTMMCAYWAEYVALGKTIQEEGQFELTASGQTRRSAVKADMNEASKNYLKLAEQYGLTAVARTRLAMMDVTTRSIESDLNARLGRNPRRTNRALDTAKREIEKE